MDLGRGLDSPNSSWAPSWAVDPRWQFGATGGLGTGDRVLRFGNGEAKSGEGSVAVGLRAI